MKTAKQLKDRVANMSGGDSTKAQTLIRKYMMERFLARIEKSRYRNNFILKGGMLVAAIVGVEYRSTMDIDTTVRQITLNKEEANKTIEEILSVDLDDGLSYEIKKSEEIMEEHDYSGIRFTLAVTMDKLRDTIKLDISTGDQITPSAVVFSYPAMFDGEKISIWSYNIETLLAEKIETVLARATLNTRMRDFYDIHILWQEHRDGISVETLNRALVKVMIKRGTYELINDSLEIMQEIAESDYMRDNWQRYVKNNYYVGDLKWEDVCQTVDSLINEELSMKEDTDLIPMM